MSWLPPSRGDVVACLSDQRRALHAKEIATRCKVPEGAYPRLLELLDQLSLDGTLRRLPGNRFKAHPDAGQDRATWEGVLSAHPRGFGFVNAAGHDDVYIAPDGMGGALHGDRVQVSLIGRSSRGSEGRIESVVARRNPRVAGVLKKRRRSAWLEPDDTRVRGPIVLTTLPRDAKDGDAAVVSITRFPDALDENPEAELVAVLGVPGDPVAEVAKILVREQIVEEHPDAAIQEAEALAAKLRQLPSEGRVDLTEVPLLTIDPVDARDHDDAVYAERRDDGFRLWVAIADVSEYVKPGSALDAEALSRGATIYLPDRAIPMLPAALAADLCSLLPERERMCLCVIADLDKRGTVKSFDIVEGIMRGAAMVTYAGVARALGFSETAARSPAADRFKRELKVLDEVTRKLRRARMGRGALELDLPEPKLELDPETGAPIAVTRRAQDPGVKRAYTIVEELMILANELVAQWLSKQRCPSIYRVHAKPDPKKLERLGSACEVLNAFCEVDELTEPKGVKRWMERIAGHEKRSVLEMLLLRSMKQAVYDIANIGHFGLASDAYLHFTSPIRRYPDIEVHRAVKRLLRGEKPDKSPAFVEALRARATASSTRERAAMDVEREVVDLYRTLYMRDHIEDVFEGTVTAIVGGGMFVTLDEPFVDVLVRFESMGPDHYEVDGTDLSLVGARSGDRISLGDRVTVAIEDVAILRRSVYARRVLSDKALADLERAERGRPGRGGRGRKEGARRTEGRREAPPKKAGGPSGGTGGRPAKTRRRR